jgi:beta-glucanase (GH16 family)
MKLWILLLAAGLCAAQPQGQLVWSDEFNGAADTAPDSAKWTYDLGNNNGWGNRELENYTKDPENAHLDGKGNLVIRAEPDKSAPGSYTSARIKTQGLFAAEPNGRVEARIKVPSGAGIWPAFWMLGSSFTGRNWPACGEIDIMESLGREPSINHGSLHGPGYSGAKPMTSIYTLPDGRKFSDDYHVFAIDWTPTQITFYVDDTAYETVHETDIPAGTKWVFNQPFFIILNVAVGGNFGGALAPDLVFPREMLVDYVRVYKRP